MTTPEPSTTITGFRPLSKAQWDAMEKCKYKLAQAIIEARNAGLWFEAHELQEKFNKLPPSYIDGTSIPNHIHDAQ
jgi:hypothetical protein